MDKSNIVDRSVRNLSVDHTDQRLFDQSLSRRRDLVPAHFLVLSSFCFQKETTAELSDRSKWYQPFSRYHAERARSSLPRDSDDSTNSKLGLRSIPLIR